MRRVYVMGLDWVVVPFEIPFARHSILLERMLGFEVTHLLVRIGQAEPQEELTRVERISNGCYNS